MYYASHFQYIYSGYSDTIQTPGEHMAISHELSSEIAVALFSAKERSPQELDDLKDMVLKIHSTLEQMTRDANMARVDRMHAFTLQPLTRQATKDS